VLLLGVITPFELSLMIFLLIPLKLREN